MPKDISGHTSTLVQAKSDVIQQRMFVYLGPILLTWINFNPSMDK